MDLPALDICNSSQLDAFFKDKNINIVINCAAYTAVDKAEKDADIAEKVNAIGVLNLVNALEKVNGKLIHISTDYVFDGNQFFTLSRIRRSKSHWCVWKHKKKRRIGNDQF